MSARRAASKSPDAAPGGLSRVDPPRVPRTLATALDVRRELAALYREARAGKLPVADASRLGSLLAQILRALAADDLARRVDRLESELRAAGIPL